MTKTKTALFGLFSLLAGSAVAMPTASAAVFVVHGPTEPPPEVVVERPAPRHGHVWVGGHHRWHRKHYVWRPGHYVRERPGYQYESGRWENRGGRYHWHDGRWHR